MNKRYWLFKSEPTVFSFDDLLRAPGATAGWEGVRNYQARNFLRDSVQVGDEVLFYHSSTEPPGVVGTATVARAGYPDPTQFEPSSRYFDPASTPVNPRWYQVDLKARRKLGRLVSLAELKASPPLAGMLVIKKGVRLSIQPVTEQEYAQVVRLGSR